MSAIDETVQSKLKAQRGSDEALSLWRKLWAAYADGGPEGVAELLDKLIATPDGEEGER